MKSLADAAATPPRAEGRALETSHHGRTRRDPYAWLRAENWQEVMHDPSSLAPEIRAQLEAENAWTASVMAGTEALQERLFSEMRGRIKEDDSSVPSPDGPYAYATRYRTGGEHPLLVRTPRGGGEEETLLDGDALAEGRGYFRLGGAGHAPDHRLLYYATDTAGSEFYTIRIRDLATGEDLPDEITDTTGGAVWSPDGRALYYTRLDANHRPRQVFRHVVGEDAAKDELVYEEADAGFFVGVGRTQSRRFVVIDAHDHETSEVWLIDTASPDPKPRLVAPRETGIEYHVEHHGTDLVILTNRDDAEDFKLVTAPVEDPAVANWRDLVPHREGRYVIDAVPYADHLVRLEREDGLPRIVIRRWSDGTEHEISFPEEAYALGVMHGYEYETDEIRFSYSSLTTPARVYDYAIGTGERTLRKEQEVPSGHDPERYVVRRVHAPAPDGETVPISVLMLKDTPRDGSAPCLLYGYGSYGITIPAGFNTNILSLVNRGFVFALAHIRGGRDKGQRWYREGKTAKKLNTFSDFIAAADHLAAERYTAHDRIVAHGGSAGGMLMGAVANMAPERFLAIVAEVPFVDTLATMLDDTLPLTPPEWPEWGNPIERVEDYDLIASYSPYDNVRAQAYPHILALAGLTDPRVTYWEAAKWVARLRNEKTDDNILALKVNMSAGHAGASGRFDRLKEVALVYAFALKVTGLADRE
ncbi:S9 family peptidase [Lutibaculum baratangense]|uniref:Protease II n=1 Tax=Lutibaculum baratangense AMV1 TaxID=631454 RepID=V4RBG8_9HYPH|nr:S9 family peptidase [Lutibaculum baratangense]ESR22749.1 Protease II [Lutibaculum baratangense AMV1]